MSTILHPLSHHISKANGVVFWKNRPVEHYSYGYDDVDREREASATFTLCTRCAHLEALGVPVSTSTAVFFWPWFETGQPGDPWNALLARICDLYVNRVDGAVAVVYQGAHHHGRDITSILYRDGQPSTLVIPAHSYGRYHAFSAAGFDYARVGQDEHLGICYATRDQIIRFLSEHNITPATWPHALAA